MDSKTQRVGVYRIGHLGDMVVAMPALWTIRKFFPEATITLLSKQRQVGTLAQATNILRDGLVYDDVVAYDVEGGRALGAIWRTLRALRKRKLEVIAYLPTDARSEKQMSRDRLFFRLAGIKRVVGMEGLRRTKHCPPGSPLPTVPNETDNLLRYLKLDGIEVDTPAEQMFELGLTDDERAFAVGFLAKAGILPAEPGRPSIGMTPGSKMEAKRWPTDRFIEVARWLKQAHNAQIVLFGAANERDLCAELADAIPGIVNAAGELTVRQSVAVLEHLDLYLGNDTGTMHMASAVGTPCVALFSARDWPGRWYPYGDSHTILRQAVECEGCMLETCPFDNKCLKLIETSAVIEACRSHLDSRS